MLDPATSRLEVDPGPQNPLFRWPGGKRFLLPQILRHLPNTFGRYYEPFFGGGALFFSLQPARATICDHNAELMECYVEVRDHPEELISLLQQMPNSEDNYYEVRATRPRTPTGRAARTIYLAKLAFNGIYRVNLKGEFNVPYGSHPDHPPSNPCDPAHVRAASRILQGQQILAGDFALGLKGCRKGDLVYLDPPYTVAHSNNGFVKYNAKIFSWDDQIRLAHTAHGLAERGCHVVVSNAYHKTIHELYDGFHRYTISRTSVIAAVSEHRRGIQEYLFTSS